MKRVISCMLTAVIAVACSTQPKNDVQSPMLLIMETDLGNDVDDALAMDMLYKYMDSGKINLLMVGVNKEGTAPVEYMDILNTWYGYPDIPVGSIHNGIDCSSDSVNYAEAVVNMRAEDGSNLFERSNSGYENYPESHALYREVLSQQPDNSVTIASVGFSTNLVRLLESPADEFSPLTGKELVARKVKLLVVMAGCFVDTSMKEYNVWKDVPSAKLIFEEWPSPVVASPFDVGDKVLYPATSIEQDFGWAEHHPVALAYKSYLPMPYDRPTWDPTAVLYAVEGGDWFTVSPCGDVEVTEDGRTIFTENENGTRRYLSVTAEQAAAIRDYFVKTITSVPKNRK